MGNGILHADSPTVRWLGADPLAPLLVQPLRGVPSVIVSIPAWPNERDFWPLPDLRRITSGSGQDIGKASAADTRGPSAHHETVQAFSCYMVCHAHQDAALVSG